MIVTRKELRHGSGVTVILDSGSADKAIVSFEGGVASYLYATLSGRVWRSALAGDVIRLPQDARDWLLSAEVDEAVCEFLTTEDDE